jgi:hypothetical protein
LWTLQALKARASNFSPVNHEFVKSKGTKSGENGREVITVMNMPGDEFLD